MEYVTNFRSDEAPEEPSHTLLNYHGACTQPYVLPLHRRLLFKQAQLYDVFGKLPEGAVPHVDPSDWVDAPTAKLCKLPTVRVWASVRCGKCEKCAYRRFMRYATAARGWYRTTRLSIFVSFTFSNAWFAAAYGRERAVMDDRAHHYLSGLAGFKPDDYSLEQSFVEPPLAYDATNPDHFSFVRMELGRERTKFMKRFRQSLNRRAVFKGVKLAAHVELMELGDLRGRPHLHGLLHFDYEGDDTFEINGTDPDLYLHLRSEMKDQWFAEGQGVGFLDAKRVNSEQSGDASACYLFKYLLKLVRSGDVSKRIASDTRIATSLAYIGRGRDRYQATLDAGDEPAGEESDLECRADAELDHSLATGGVKGLSDSEVPYTAQALAMKIAHAREAWNVGDLWPGYEAGASLPAGDFRWLPPHESDFFGWISSVFAPDGPATWFVGPRTDDETDESSDYGVDI